VSDELKVLPCLYEGPMPPAARVHVRSYHYQPVTCVNIKVHSLPFKTKAAEELVWAALGNEFLAWCMITDPLKQLQELARDELGVEMYTYGRSGGWFGFETRGREPTGEEQAFLAGVPHFLAQYAEDQVNTYLGGYDYTSIYRWRHRDSLKGKPYKVSVSFSWQNSQVQITKPNGKSVWITSSPEYGIKAIEDRAGRFWGEEYLFNQVREFANGTLEKVSGMSLVRRQPEGDLVLVGGEIKALLNRHVVPFLNRLRKLFEKSEPERALQTV